jgi:hypothetical protein
VVYYLWHERTHFCWYKHYFQCHYVSINDFYQIRLTTWKYVTYSQLSGKCPQTRFFQLVQRVSTIYIQLVKQSFCMPDTKQTNKQTYKAYSSSWGKWNHRLAEHSEVYNYAIPMFQIKICFFPFQKKLAEKKAADKLRQSFYRINIH